MAAKRMKNYQVLLLVSLAIFLFLIVKAVLFFIAKPHIAVNYVAEWNRISKPENYDPNQNAYFDYAKVSSFIPEIPAEMQGYGSFKWPEWPEDFNESRLTFLKDWLAKSSKYFGYLKAGSEKPYYWFEAPQDSPRWEIRNPLPIELRASITPLCWRARLNAFEGKIDEALDDLLAGYKIGSQLNCLKGKAFEQYFGKGIQSAVIDTFLIILNNKQIDAKALSDFHGKIKSEIARNAQSPNVNEERLFSYDIIQRIFTDDGKGGGHLIPKEAKKMAKYLQPSRSGGTISPSPAGGSSFVQKMKDALSYIRYDYRGDLPNFYRLALKGANRKKTVEDLEKIYSFLDQAQWKNPYQFRSENIDMEKEVEKMTNDYWARILAFASYWPADFERFYQHKCEADSFFTVIAIMCFKADKGRFPDSLEELIDSGLTEELPQDPYNEGPLTYKKVGDNFTLYSLGTNFADNGGVIVRDRYSGKIILWDRQKRADAVFWPYPNESRQRRLERMGQITIPEPNEMINGPDDSNSQSEK